MWTGHELIATEQPVISPLEKMNSIDDPQWLVIMPALEAKKPTERHFNLGPVFHHIHGKTGFRVPRSSRTLEQQYRTATVPRPVPIKACAVGIFRYQKETMFIRIPNQLQR